MTKVERISSDQLQPLLDLILEITAEQTKEKRSNQQDGSAQMTLESHPHSNTEERKKV